MGNSNSSSRRPDIKSITRSSRVPKHLQPLKRKQPKKSGSTSSSSIEPKSSADTNPRNNHHLFALKKQDKYNNRAISNPAKTLQPKFYDSDSLERIFNDHAISSPQIVVSKHRRTKFRDADDKHLPLPSTQIELDRQRVQLYIMRWAFESRHLVPPIIKKQLFEGIRVLDIGCGPGLWLGHPIIEMAEDFRKSKFDSVDICNLLPPKPQSEDTSFHFSRNPKVVQEPIDTKTEQLADNLTFTLHNVVKDGPLPFADNTFDYVQQSQVLLVYNKADWKRIMLELIRVTKPGGYVRLLEVDLYPQPLGAMGGAWRDQIHQCIANISDIPTRMALHLDKQLLDAGAEDVVAKFVTIPLGSWGLDIGILWEQNVYGFLEAFSPFVRQITDLTEEEYEAKKVEFLEELKDETIRPFNNIYMAWGRIKESESI